MVDREKTTCDLFVLLSHLSLSENIEIAEKVADLDVIIVSTNPDEPYWDANAESPKVTQVNKTLILSAANRPGLMGELKLFIANWSWRFADISADAQQLNQVKTAIRHIEAITHRTERGESRLKALIRERGQLQKNLVRPLKHHQNPYTLMIQPIRSNVADNKEIQAMVEACKHQMAALAASNPPPPRQVEDSRNGGAEFIGAVACRTCHQEQYQIWKQSKHAHAYETLVHRNRAFDFECLPCHTTGNQFEGGSWQRSAIGNSEGVQCESCHGPGEEHAGLRGERLNSPGEKVCRHCHTPRDSPDFNFHSYLTKPICFSR